MNTRLVLVSVVCSIFTSLSHGKEAITSTSKLAAASNVASAETLPVCINDPKTLDSIDQSRKQNSKNQFKYRAIKEALASDSDDQLIARLTYAETLAANCPEFANEIIAPIAVVIQNRARQRNGDVRSVVFQRDQFASSLNSYDGSKWREFLCPTDAVLWKKALQAARASLPNFNSLVTNISPSAYNYYLFRHSTKFSVPEWAKQEPAKFSNAEKVADCLKIYSGKFN